MLDKHVDEVSKSFVSSKGHTYSFPSVEENIFQDNNEVVLQCYEAQSFEENSAIFTKGIEVFSTETSLIHDATLIWGSMSACHANHKSFTHLWLCRSRHG